MLGIGDRWAIIDRVFDAVAIEVVIARIPHAVRVGIAVRGARLIGAEIEVIGEPIAVGVERDRTNVIEIARVAYAIPIAVVLPGVRRSWAIVSGVSEAVTIGVLRLHARAFALEQLDILAVVKTKNREIVRATADR